MNTLWLKSAVIYSNVGISQRLIPEKIRTEIVVLLVVKTLKNIIF